MSRHLLSLSVPLVAGALLLSATQAKAGSDLPRETALLVQETTQLSEFVQQGLVQAPGYAQLVRLSSRLEAEAIQFERELASGSQVRGLERRLNEVDDAARDLSNALFDVGRASRYDRFAPVYDTRQLQQFANSIERRIERMDDVLADLPARSVIAPMPSDTYLPYGGLPANIPPRSPAPAAPQVYGSAPYQLAPEVLPAPPVPVTPRGLSIGVPGFSLRIREF